MAKEWTRLDGKTSRFNFVLQTAEYISPEEYKEMVNFCNLNFGSGGHMPNHDDRWFVGITRSLFAFRTETDRLIFYIAFCS